MTDKEINAMEEIAEKVNKIFLLKVQIQSIMDGIENEDFKDCLRDYLEAIDEAEDYVFDTLRAY